jgi:D-alanyl-D-alanine carboxypeptidase
MTTALVAVERAALGSTVRGTANSASEPSIIGIEPGDELLLKDAIYGLMLNSGNDAALAIAESVGEGSIPRFVTWMNLSVERMGLTDTQFKNPNGLEQDGHYSTAYDTAMIGRQLLRHGFLSDVVATRRHEVPGPPLWVFSNSNPLLGRLEGINGIKTGYETNAGRCFVVSMSRNGHQVIASLLHDDQYAMDARRLFEWAFESFEWSTVRVPASESRQLVSIEVVYPPEQGDVVRSLTRLERVMAGASA